MNSTNIVGTWRLVSLEGKLSDGRKVYPFGEMPQGMLIYGEKGNMSVQVMKPDRPNFAADDQFRGTAAEIEAAFDGCLCFFGRYEINEAGSEVTHHVEVSLYPNWMGGKQVRKMELNGDILSLTSPVLKVSGQEAALHFVWHRA